MIDPRRRAWTLGALLSAAAIVFATGVGAVIVRSNPAAAGIEAAPGRTVAAEPASRPGVGLPERLRTAGYALPDQVSVYAAQVLPGPDGTLGLVEFEAGGGARHEGFWPASSVKVLAALGALDFLRSQGFSGAATVEASTGWTDTVRQLAEDAIEDSSNPAYDRLLQIAGLDRLNTDFLTPANGFPATVIQRSYSGIDVRSSPQLGIREGARSVVVPPRRSTTDHGCPDNGNCSNLYELTESVRRVVLDTELPPGERLDLDPVDLGVLDDALLASVGWLEPGVTKALGLGAGVYNKPGVAGGLDCVDVALVADAETGHRYLLGITSPASESTDCAILARVAEEVLRVLVT